MFNLIQAKKTKNTMILEPISKPETAMPKLDDEVGQGLREQSAMLNKGQEEFDPTKQHFIVRKHGQSKENASGFRSWSRQDRNELPR